MGLVSGIVVYLLTWWVVIFTMLPLWVKPHKDKRYGTAGSAPEKPELGKKFLLTSIISAVIWVIFYILIKSDILSFQQIAEHMAQEDKAL